jgi:hypothetical protein
VGSGVKAGWGIPELAMDIYIYIIIILVYYIIHYIIILYFIVFTVIIEDIQELSENRSSI